MLNAMRHLALRLAERTGTLRHFNVTVDIPVNGDRVTLPLGGHQDLNQVGIHEPELLGVMRELLSEREGAVLDIGANTGQTLVKFLGLGLDRPYVAFEPSLFAAAQVKRIATVNGAENVTVLPIALADAVGVMEFSTSGPFDQAATLVPDVQAEGFFKGRAYVPVVRGDTVAEAMGLQPALIKIDAEGAEADVVRGLARTIQRYRPAIICELMPTDGVEGRDVRKADLVDLLGSWGYAPHCILEDGGRMPGIGPAWNHLFLPSE